jgi:asparagine synthase (glutamine-hydrolysing)
MCGIAGEVKFTSEPATLEWVQRACGVMRHRGPDGEGFIQRGRAALGHRRLSIIDLQTGGQPLAYGGGHYWITYNGEIYNYRELRSELAAGGWEFATQSDTEVILAAYAAWGTGCLAKLNGIFAFGIWDCQEERLLLARDPLGVKPLLYHLDAEGLQFCSELKGLLCHAAVRPEVDADALQDYLSLGYVLAPRTILKGVQKLEPGHFLLVDAKGPVQEACYWDLAQECVASASRRLNTAQQREAIAEFSERLEHTTEMQMVSDVPLGAFLSGGIDSSSIVYHAAHKVTDHRLNTFSIGFNEASFSELDYAGLAARGMDTEHHELVVPPQGLERLAELVRLYDEPLGDTSLIPTYFVSALARERVTVVLSGDGSDELLAGYDTYLADRIQGLYRHIPGWLHRGVVQPVVQALVPPSDKKVSINFMIRQFVSQAHGSAERAHYGWRMMFSDEERQALASTGAWNQGGYHPFEAYRRHYRAVEGADALSQSLYVDIKTWMVDDILVKVDRASMACSLESRVPFLAPDLAAFTMGLPAGLKLHGLQRKYLLKQAMRGRLPDEILYRKKRGFNAPISHWLRGELGDAAAHLFEEQASTLVDLKSPLVQKLWNEHRSGANDHGFKLWTLLSFVLWEQQVLKAHF